jgi:hypothetical protein
VRAITIAAVVLGGVATLAVGRFALGWSVRSAEEPRRPPSDNYEPVATELRDGAPLVGGKKGRRSRGNVR